MSTPQLKKNQKRNAFIGMLFYVLTVLCLAGGAGIWLPAALPGREVGMDAVLSFVMAALAPIGADQLLGSRNIATKHERMMLFAACAGSGIFALLAFIREKEPSTPVWLAAVAIAGAIICWIWFYSGDERFQEPDPPTVPGEGDVTGKGIP